MVKISYRFLAILLLAVLAFTDVTTTSAFAQRGAFPIRPPGHVEVPWRLDHAPGSDAINRGRILENFGVGSWPGEPCTFACGAKRPPGRVDSPW
jgi:hypothetical protein